MHSTCTSFAVEMDSWLVFALLCWAVYFINVLPGCCCCLFGRPSVDFGSTSVWNRFRLCRSHVIPLYRESLSPQPRFRLNCWIPKVGVLYVNIVSLSWCTCTPFLLFSCVSSDTQSGRKEHANSWCSCCNPSASCHPGAFCRVCHRGGRHTFIRVHPVSIFWCSSF